MELSEYEQQRLRNMATNAAALEALGIEPVAKTATTPPGPTSAVESPDRRRVSRHAAALSPSLRTRLARMR